MPAPKRNPIQRPKPSRTAAVPVSVRLALEHNAREAGKPGRRFASRQQRLRERFERFAAKELRRSKHTGELKLTALSFRLWELTVACGWDERQLGDAGLSAAWSWFIGLHHAQADELAHAGLIDAKPDRPHQAYDERFHSANARRKF